MGIEGCEVTPNTCHIKCTDPGNVCTKECPEPPGNCDPIPECDPNASEAPNTMNADKCKELCEKSRDAVAGPANPNPCRFWRFDMVIGETDADGHLTSESSCTLFSSKQCQNFEFCPGEAEGGQCQCGDVKCASDNSGTTQSPQK